MAGKKYIDPLLTNDALGYKPHGMVNQIILPARFVKKDTGKIANYGADNIRLVTAMKGPDSPTPVVTMNTVIQDGWAIDPYALKAFASDAEIENEDMPFNARRDKSRLVMNLLELQREIGLALFMQDDGNFTNSLDLTGGDQWDTVNGDVIGDINTAIETVSDAIGVPDTELSVLVSRKLQRHFVKLADIQGLVHGTFGLRNTAKVSQIKPEELASAFEVKEWIVADGHYNSAVTGQTPVIAPIWGNGFWIFHRVTNPEMLSLPFGFTMRKKNAIVVDRWYDRDAQGEWVRGSDAWDQWIVNETSGYFIKNPLDLLADLS